MSSKLLEIVLKIQKSDEPYEQVVIKIGHLLSKIKRSLELLVVKNSSKKDIFSSLDDDQVALIRNSQARIVACKQALLAYIEAKFDHHQLVSLPDDLAQLTSNLINLKQTRLGNLLAVLDRYVRSQLFADTSEIKASRMEDFADILSSVDLFLVKLLNDGDCSSKLLELGESAAGELRYRIGFQNVDSAEIEIHAEQILGRVEELNSRSRTSKSLDNFNKERLYRDDYFIIEEADLLEEIELHEAITQGDKAIAKLERLIPPFNKRNRPNFDE